MFASRITYDTYYLSYVHELNNKSKMVMLNSGVDRFAL